MLWLPRKGGISSETGEALGENPTILAPLLSNNISQEKVVFFLHGIVGRCLPACCLSLVQFRIIYLGLRRW